MSADAPSNPGRTDAENRIGRTMPISLFGLACSRLRASARRNRVLQPGHMTGADKWSQDQADLARRRILPPKTVAQTRRLVESDASPSIIFARHRAKQRHREIRKAKNVTQLFWQSGASKFGIFPSSKRAMGIQASFRSEARLYAKYAVEKLPEQPACGLARR